MIVTEWKTKAMWKALDKTQHPIIIKNSTNYQWCLWKSHSLFILDVERLNAFLLRAKPWQECPFQPLLFIVLLQLLVRITGREKGKGTQIGKEVVTVLICKWDNLVCTTSKEATKKLLQLINSTRWKIQDQFSSVQPLSLFWLCDPMNCSTPGLPVHHQLPESTQTHVHRKSKRVPEKHLFLLYWLCQSLWLCGSQ